MYTSFVIVYIWQHTVRLFGFNDSKFTDFMTHPNMFTHSTSHSDPGKHSYYHSLTHPHIQCHELVHSVTLTNVLSCTLTNNNLSRWRASTDSLTHTFVYTHKSSLNVCLTAPSYLIALPLPFTSRIIELMFTCFPKKIRVLQIWVTRDRFVFSIPFLASNHSDFT